MDPYDDDIIGIGWIHSFFVIQYGVAFGPEDENVNVINVTSNIPLPYEDKIDGCIGLK